MTAPAAVPPRPAALLIDFGGVLADVPPGHPPRPAAPPDVVARLHDVVAGAVPAPVIARDLAAGHTAYARWRDEDHPEELTHEQVWAFVTAGWPGPAAEAVRRAATPLSYQWAWRPEWRLRPGVEGAVRAADAAGVPLAVVSNALCGAAHRDLLAQTGIGGLFAAQIYSDEVGLRKPDPEMIRRAGRALGVPVEGCWFVGDSRQRDVQCARRAGVAFAVLMRSARTAREDPGRWPGPDATVDDGHGLLALLRTGW